MKPRVFVDVEELDARDPRVRYVVIANRVMPIAYTATYLEAGSIAAYHSAHGRFECLDVWRTENGGLVVPIAQNVTTEPCEE